MEKEVGSWARLERIDALLRGTQPRASFPVIPEVLEERRERDGEPGQQRGVCADARPFEGSPEVVDVAPDEIEPDRFVGRAVGNPYRRRRLAETAKLGSDRLGHHREVFGVSPSQILRLVRVELFEGELADRFEQEKRGSPSGVEVTRTTL